MSINIMSTAIKKYEFKTDLPLQIEVVDIAASFAKYRDTWIAPHRTGFYHIFFWSAGHASHLVDFKQVESRPGTLLFLKKECVHAFDPSGAYDGKLLIFTDEFFCQTEADIKFLRTTPLFNDLYDVDTLDPGNGTENLRATFDMIIAELAVPEALHRHDLLQNLLQNFLIYAERKKTAQGPHMAKESKDLSYTMAFRERLDRDYQKKRNVSHYAQHLHISDKRLTQATTKVLGKTPKEMIDDRVVLEMKRLTVHSHSTIKEIGFQLGFDEPTNFIKYFRKHTGKTPSEFREQFLRQ
jgi:AraC-like DNA-binding protein